MCQALVSSEIIFFQYRCDIEKKNRDLSIVENMQEYECLLAHISEVKGCDETQAQKYDLPETHGP